jgi:hypothetical protein
MVAVAVLVAFWWAFRPEKLWINAKVNEAAPVDTSGGPQPILTGRFEGKSQQIMGRATIYKKPGGQEYLRLSDFAASNAPDAHVALGRSEGDTDRIDLGPLKNNQGDQNYELPASADRNEFGAVVISDERSHAVLGLARLESF